MIYFNEQLGRQSRATVHLLAVFYCDGGGVGREHLGKFFPPFLCVCASHGKRQPKRKKAFIVLRIYAKLLASKKFLPPLHLSPRVVYIPRKCL